MNDFDIDFTWNVESLIIFRDRSAHITGVFSPYPFSVTKRNFLLDNWRCRKRGESS